MYQTKELKLGDVIIDMGKGKEPVAYHALMWVGGEKPLAHATEGKTVSLVVRHRLPYLRGEDIGKFPSPPVDQYYVYRHNNEKVGAKAAEFAILWASDPSATKVTAGEKPKPTPYSPPRRQEGVTVVQALEKLAAADEWDTMALFHAVRAYAKLKNNFALSGRGVSCSQFITYCYQCASIEALVGTISPPKETLFNLIHTDRAIALKTDMNVIAVKRAAIASFTSEPTQERKPPGKTGAELMKAHFF